MNEKQLTFITKRAVASGGNCSKIDVSVTSNQNGEYVAFSLSARCVQMMNKPDALVGACSGGRIYFKQAKKEVGFAVAYGKNNTRAGFRFPAKLLSLKAANVIGYYDICYDAECNLFYIDLDKKITC